LKKGSTASVPFSNDDRGRVRVTIDVDNGAAGNDVKFWVTGTDITLADGTSWDQLGATVTTAGTTSIHDGNSELAVGGRSITGAQPIPGNLFGAQVYDGIDGEKVANMDPTDYVNKLTDTTFNSNLMAIDLPGAVGDFGSTPNALTNRITGDIDLRSHINLVDYSPASTQTLISKIVLAGDQRSYWFLLDVFGKLELLIYEDGTAGSVVTYQASEAVSTADRTTTRFRAALDVDNGAGDSECTFFYVNRRY